MPLKLHQNSGLQTPLSYLWLYKYVLYFCEVHSYQINGIILDLYQQLDRLLHQNVLFAPDQDLNQILVGWHYDPRGNIIRELKNITLGGGSFLTQWTYNSAGLVTSLTYPGGNSGQAGEEVQYTYNKRSLLETMIGTNNYIISSQYDTNGRLIEK